MLMVMGTPTIMSLDTSTSTITGTDISTGHAASGAGPAFLRPHRHDHADSLDDAVLADRAGGRALAISLTGLLITATVHGHARPRTAGVGAVMPTVYPVPALKPLCPQDAVGMIGHLEKTVIDRPASRLDPSIPDIPAVQPD